jgi:pilus assembly protein CpaC
LPANIAEMPLIDDELEVIHHRSQLIRARSRIVRTAIADPGVIEVVNYSESEIGIIGVVLGSTTLMIWFENSAKPLIYLVKTVSDPELEARRRIDYGKLERQLAVLFPNSKVYLIPLKQQVVVRGQARDAQEASQILQIIRREYLATQGNDPFGVGNAGNGAGGAGNANNVANQANQASSFIVNMLEVPGEKQVMLHVKIAELSRGQLRQLGVDLDILLNAPRHALTTAAGGIPSTLTGIFENGEVNVLVNWLAGNGSIGSRAMGRHASWHSRRSFVSVGIQPSSCLGKSLQYRRLSD